MKRLLALLLLMLAWPAAAVTLDGAVFDEASQVGSAALVLNGAGIRTRFFFKIYAIGLYLPAKQDNAAAVLGQPGAKRIRIAMLRDLSAEKLASALIEGIRNNNSAAELAPLQARIDDLKNALLELKEVTKGTVITLDSVPGSGTHLAVSGQARERVIPGEDFYPALLRIWLGEHPVAADLKGALLGSAR